MFEIALHNPRQHRQFRHANGPLLLARSHAELPLWTSAQTPRGEEFSATLHILPHASGVALSMAGCEKECHCGRTCPLTGECEFEFPASFTIGDTRFEITAAPTANTTTTRQLQKLRYESADARDKRTASAGPSPATLSRWFAALGTLNHWATSLQELFVQAARCAVEAIGLDGAIVLRRRDEEWEIAASHLPHPELGIHCDLAALDVLLTAPETHFHGNSTAHLSEIAANSAALVVSPLRSASGTLVGAIYGFRSVRSGNHRRSIRYLEAHWIELLAGAVSDAMTRLERESEVDRRRVLLERALSSASESERRRYIGETREVTLLFADLRDFTRIAASLEMDVVYELLGQVMDALTAAVMDHDGLVLDYYGDGLAAMWNAPADQAEHAELACRAGLKMLEALPAVAADWRDICNVEFRLGIGIHTGEARIGNAGSNRRAKYGPRGTNVNLTSRVESATKELGLPLIVTGETVARLSKRFTTHRVCRARLQGLDTPVDLFAVQPASAACRLAPEWTTYSEALNHFEHGDFDRATATLTGIDHTIQEVPAKFLAEYIQRETMRRRNRRRTEDRAPFTGVVSFTRK